MAQVSDVTRQSVILPELANALVSELVARATGHCVRVDYLDRQDALSACQAMRGLLPTSAEAFVLARTPADTCEIRADKAIELRNRKTHSLCLFVPADFVDAASSSLGNAFASFDLRGFLARLANELAERLPEGPAAFAGGLRRQLGGAWRPSYEQEIDYYSSVLADPTVVTAGSELWRIGLVPDLSGETAARRLALNASCISKLIRPARADSSVADRIESLGLAPGSIQAELTRFLRGRLLQGDDAWLRELLDPSYRGRLTFEQWHFPDVEPSDLEEVILEPFVDAAMRVTAYSGLRQRGGPETELIAVCGPKRKLKVKWASLPSTPVNVSGWRVELVPSSLDHSDAGSAEDVLPRRVVSPRHRTASISLDLDLDELETTIVEVRVCAVGADGDEIRSRVAASPEHYAPVIEARSLRFRLAREESEDSESLSEAGQRVPTVRSLSDAKVLTALRHTIEDPSELCDQPMPREDDGACYLPFLIGRRFLWRLTSSSFLSGLQRMVLERPDTGGRFRASIAGAEILSTDSLHDDPISPGVLLEEHWRDFISARRRCFASVLAQEGRGCVEAADYDDALTALVREYVRAYGSLLEDALSLVVNAGDNSGPLLEGVAEVLQTDSLAISFGRSGEIADAVVLMPTHPIRLAWHIAYSQLMDFWARGLVGLAPAERRAALSEHHLLQLAPFNVPAFFPAGRRRTYLFAANLTFFHGLYIPTMLQEPAGVISDVARLVGLEWSPVPEAAFPPSRVAERIGRYLRIHDYVRTLRVNVLNPGGGEFVSRVFADIPSGENIGEPSVSARLPAFDVITHSEAGVQYPAPGLAALARQLRDLRADWDTWHLAPAAQVSRRRSSDQGELPGGDVNLSICLDQFSPTLELASAHAPRSSASVYGLLTRFLASFFPVDDAAAWTYKVSLCEDPRIERHPVSRAYTENLVRAHDRYLRLSACVHGWGNHVDSVPALRLEITPERREILRALHEQSDWVMFLDRHFGVEYFDNPDDPYLATQARRYLLDYVPEYVEGIGHRLLITTAWQGEVSGILRRALDELGFGSDEATVRYLLDTLKSISGRLAFRLLGDENQAKEVVSLAVAVAYLREQGRLRDAILIPMDAHTDILDAARGASSRLDSSDRCDLLAFELTRTSARCRFIEVKYRGHSTAAEQGALLERVAEQTESTEIAIRDLYFPEQQRLDQAVIRCQLAGILQFYLDRAHRHGLIGTSEKYEELCACIAELEAKPFRLRAEHLGYIITPSASAENVIERDGCKIAVIGPRQVDSMVNPLYVAGGGDRSQGAEAPQAEAEAVDEPVSSAGVQPEEAGDAAGQEGTSPTGQAAVVRAEKTEAAISSPLIGAATPGEFAVPLGRRVENDSEVYWRGSTTGSPHLFVLGITGQGKSWTILRLLSEVQQQIPILVLDFHGEYARSETPFARVVRPTVIDASRGLPFSPFEASSRRGDGTSYWKMNSLAVSEIIEYVCDLGDIQRDTVYRAIRDCYEAAGFADDTGSSDLEYPTIPGVLRRLGELESKSAGTRNVVARCRPIFEFELFRPAADGSGSFAEFLQSPCVVDLHSVGHETLQRAAGAFLLRKLYKEMFTWGEANTIRLLVVLDEAHRLAKDTTLPLMMKEGRKFGVAIVVASQSPVDFHRDVVGNAGTRIVFRMNYPESKQAAKFLTPRNPRVDLSAKVEQLAVGHAFVQTPERYCGVVSMYPYQGVPELGLGPSTRT